MTSVSTTPEPSATVGENEKQSITLSNPVSLDKQHVHVEMTAPTAAPVSVLNIIGGTMMPLVKPSPIPAKPLLTDRRAISSPIMSMIPQSPSPSTLIKQVPHILSVSRNPSPPNDVLMLSKKTGTPKMESQFGDKDCDASKDIERPISSSSASYLTRRPSGVPGLASDLDAVKVDMCIATAVVHARAYDWVFVSQSVLKVLGSSMAVSFDLSPDSCCQRYRCLLNPHAPPTAFNSSAVVIDDKKKFTKELPMQPYIDKVASGILDRLRIMRRDRVSMSVEKWMTEINLAERDIAVAKSGSKDDELRRMFQSVKGSLNAFKKGIMTIGGKPCSDLILPPSRLIGLLDASTSVSNVDRPLSVVGSGSSPKLNETNNLQPMKVSPMTQPPTSNCEQDSKTQPMLCEKTFDSSLMASDPRSSDTPIVKTYESMPTVITIPPPILSSVPIVSSQLQSLHSQLPFESVPFPLSSIIPTTFIKSESNVVEISVVKQEVESSKIALSQTKFATHESNALSGSSGTLPTVLPNRTVDVLPTSVPSSNVPDTPKSSSDPATSRHSKSPTSSPSRLSSNRSISSVKEKEAYKDVDRAKKPEQRDEEQEQEQEREQGHEQEQENDKGRQKDKDTAKGKEKEIHIVRPSPRSSPRSLPASAPVDVNMTPFPCASPTSQAISAELNVMLSKILKTIHSNKDSLLFRKPVDLTLVPDYLDVVRRPMDLGTLKRRLDDGEITTSKEFFKEFFHIFNNAMSYNEPGSDIYKIAKGLKAFVTKEMAMVQEWERDRDVLRTSSSANDGGASSAGRISRRTSGGLCGNEKEGDADYNEAASVTGSESAGAKLTAPSGGRGIKRRREPDDSDSDASGASGSRSRGSRRSRVDGDATPKVRRRKVTVTTPRSTRSRG